MRWELWGLLVLFWVSYYFGRIRNSDDGEWFIIGMIVAFSYFVGLLID